MVPAPSDLKDSEQKLPPIVCPPSSQISPEPWDVVPESSPPTTGMTDPETENAEAENVLPNNLSQVDDLVDLVTQTLLQDTELSTAYDSETIDYGEAGPLRHSAWDTVVDRLKSNQQSPATESTVDPKVARAQQLSDEGFLLLRQKNLKGAWEAWSEALRLAPNNRTYQVNTKRLAAKLAQTKG
ncbi:MAG: hypothetical protein CSA75_03865 [Sorangium cellulosum]|nr:MAG: hypothetical protein CSA75_03865 [Sorangium cellulosum]